MMDPVRYRLEEVVDYVRPLLPFANAHMVNFITDNLWENYCPDRLKSEVRGVDASDVCDEIWKNWKCNDYRSERYPELSQFLEMAHRMSINPMDGITLNMEDLRDQMEDWGCGTRHGLKFERFMSYKKTHEVEVMSYLVANLASLTDSPYVVDIGGGKGYLSSLLSLEYRLKVLGLDSCNIKTSGAARRAKKLQKVWKGTRKQMEATSTKAKLEGEQNEADSEWSDDIMKSNETTGEYKQLTEYVSAETDIAQLVMNSFDQECPESSRSIGLVGLHTCGSLAPVCLQQFVNNPTAMSYLINVGCCYHLMEEEDYLSSLTTRTVVATFPLSSYLKRRKFMIGRNARMLALQAKSRISTLETPVPSEALLYRAVLQKMLVTKLGTDKIPKGQVGRISDKCCSFTQYFRRAVTRLHLQIEITDEEIEEGYNSLCGWENKLKLFFMLRASLAPVFENIILLDRLLYLKEKGIDHSYLVEMFDPVVSPRCYGILAFRDGNSSISRH